MKLVRQHGGAWQLYDMEEDRTELRDLAPRNRRLVSRLARDYQRWADRVGVIDWSIQEPKVKAAWGMADLKG